MLAGLLAALFATIGAARAANELLSPAAFIADPTYKSLGLSPSGRYLVAAREIPFEEAKPLSDDDKEKKSKATLDLTGPAARGDQVIIFDLDGKEGPKGLKFEGRIVRWVEWANEDRLLVSLSIIYQLDFYSFRIALPGSRVISLDWRTNESVELFESNRSVARSNVHLSRITDLLPEDSDHVLMPAYKSGDLDLWKVNIKTGKAERIEAGASGTYHWVTDRRGRPVFHLDANPRGTIVRVYARSPDGEWNKVWVGKLRDDEESPEFWPIAPGERDGEMYVLASPKDEPRASIKVYDLATNQFKETVFSHPEVDVGGGFIDHVSGDYAGAWYVDDRYHVVLRDGELQRHIDAVNKFFQNAANVLLLDSSATGERMLFYASGPQVAGEYYLYDYNKRRLEPLFSGRPDLDPDKLARVEIVKYPARDGRLITAYLTHPPGNESGFAPLVVMPHGGPEARDAFDYDPAPQFLASRGYRVFQPNFRGSAGYGREFAEAGYGEWGGKMQDDVNDGALWLAKYGYADARSTCIVGASYGGYVALYAAMATPELYVCAVAVSAVTDLIDAVASERSDPDAFDYAVKSIGHPGKDRERLVARSPARNAAKIAVPLLIVHGTFDGVAPYAQAEKLMNALDKAGRPYEKLIIEGEGHRFEKASSKVTYMRALERFLAKHLGAPHLGILPQPRD